MLERGGNILDVLHALARIEPLYEYRADAAQEQARHEMAQTRAWRRTRGDPGGSAALNTMPSR